MRRRNRTKGGFSLIPTTENGRQLMLFIIALLSIFSFSYAISVALESSSAAHTFVAKYQNIDQSRFRTSRK